MAARTAAVPAAIRTGGDGGRRAAACLAASRAACLARAAAAAALRRSTACGLAWASFPVRAARVSPISRSVTSTW